MKTLQRRSCKRKQRVDEVEDVGGGLHRVGEAERHVVGGVEQNVAGGGERRVPGGAGELAAKALVRMSRADVLPGTNYDEQFSFFFYSSRGKSRSFFYCSLFSYD